MRNWAPQEQSKWEKQAEERATGDVEVMRTVEQTHEPTMNTTTPSVEQGGKLKVALLFMVKHGVDQHNLWMKFLKDPQAEGMFSLYIHQWQSKHPKASEVRALWEEEKLNAIFIPEVKTGWGMLAGVEFALFWAALRNPANAQFALLSEGTAPLKSPAYVYQYLMHKSENSKVCMNLPDQSLNPLRIEALQSCLHSDTLHATETPTNIRGSNVRVVGRVRKHHQWLVLARRHAVDVLAYGKEAVMRAHSALLLAAAAWQGDLAMLGASDETFVVTALLLASEARGGATRDAIFELEAGGVMRECTTFVYWRNCFKNTTLGAQLGWDAPGRITETWQILKAAWNQGAPADNFLDARTSPAKVLNDSPRDFGRNDSAPSMEYMQALVRAGFLFGRKFGNDETGHLLNDLSETLPPLWGIWDLGHKDLSDAELDQLSKAWPALDMADSQSRVTAAKCCGPEASRYSFTKSIRTLW